MKRLNILALVLMGLTSMLMASCSLSKTIKTTAGLGYNQLQIAQQANPQKPIPSKAILPDSVFQPDVKQDLTVKRNEVVKPLTKSHNNKAANLALKGINQITKGKLGKGYIQIKNADLQDSFLFNSRGGGAISMFIGVLAILLGLFFIKLGAFSVGNQNANTDDTSFGIVGFVILLLLGGLCLFFVGLYVLIFGSIYP